MVATRSRARTSSAWYVSGSNAIRRRRTDGSGLDLLNSSRLVAKTPAAAIGTFLDRALAGTFRAGGTLLMLICKHYATIASRSSIHHGF